MQKEIRQIFNRFFTEEKYLHFLNYMNEAYQFNIEFRICESPVFISKQFKNELLKASNEIIDVICREDFKALTEKAIPPHLRVPNEDTHTLFLALDFAVCKDENENFVPRLIEMQGFPSLYMYEDFLANAYRAFYPIPDNYTHLLSGFTSESYLHYFKKAILGKYAPENVILLEIEPYKQGTAIDFVVTREKLGIEPVCLSEVIKKGDKLYYKKEGKEIQIKRIYNRIIFDELLKRDELPRQLNLTDKLDVEWAGHPNWFFRISKYTMPFIKSEYVPECRFLSDIKEYPSDLENYVLKPLFSFAGSGVKFHLTLDDLQEVKEPENYILQKKVQYAEAVQSPDGGIKTEIRMLFIWPENDPRPTPAINLTRMSRGEMIGVKFNKNKTWVGGNISFFEV